LGGKKNAEGKKKKESKEEANGRKRETLTAIWLGALIANRVRSRRESNDLEGTANMPGRLLGGFTCLCALPGVYSRGGRYYIKGGSAEAGEPWEGKGNNEGSPDPSREKSEVRDQWRGGGESGNTHAENQQGSNRPRRCNPRPWLRSKLGT